MFDPMKQDRWPLALRGVLALAFGALILFANPSLTTLASLFGLFAAVDGVLNLVVAFRSRNSNSRWWMPLLEGGAGLLTGALTFFWPNLTSSVLMYLMAFWAVEIGIMEVVIAVELRQQIEHEWLLTTGGALSIVVGVLIVLFSAAGIWLAGVYAVLFGTLLIGLYTTLAMPVLPARQAETVRSVDR
jgi:uncharacterized membrane protein HdeD (DUF308 family)